MVTKRVHKRQMLLIEDEYVTQVLEYTLAYCMYKYDQPLHAFVVEGNHYHRVDGDPEGLRPQFIQELHSLLARQLNRYYGEGDAFFSSKQTNIVDNQTPADVLERIVYAMGNPVADGIEREGRNHKGIRARWPQPARRSLRRRPRPPRPGRPRDRVRRHRRRRVPATGSHRTWHRRRGLPRPPEPLRRQQPPRDGAHRLPRRSRPRHAARRGRR